MVTAREPADSAGLRRDYTQTPTLSKSYLVGVLHDATERKLTFRISQKSRQFVEFIASGIRRLGGNAWTYKEGKGRLVYVVEFSKSFLRGVKIISESEKIDYIRGYFDAEGGIAKSEKVRFYLYFGQKDRVDLEQVRQYLQETGIACGKIHNPSKTVDPDYWRFYVRAQSYQNFALKIGSWHPGKLRYLRKKR